MCGSETTYFKAFFVKFCRYFLRTQTTKSGASSHSFRCIKGKWKCFKAFHNFFRKLCHRLKKICTYINATHYQTCLDLYASNVRVLPHLVKVSKTLSRTHIWIPDAATQLKMCHMHLTYPYVGPQEEHFYAVVLSYVWLK